MQWLGSRAWRQAAKIPGGLLITCVASDMHSCPRIHLSVGRVIVLVLSHGRVVTIKIIEMGNEFRKSAGSQEIKLTINISYYNYFHSVL